MSRNAKQNAKFRLLLQAMSGDGAALDRLIPDVAGLPETLPPPAEDSPVVDESNDDITVDAAELYASARLPSYALSPEEDD